MKTQTELLNEKTEALNASMINCNATVKTVLSNLIDKTAGIARSLSDGSGNISSNEISCINDTLNDIQETVHNIYNVVDPSNIFYTYEKDYSKIKYINEILSSITNPNELSNYTAEEQEVINEFIIDELRKIVEVQTNFENNIESFYLLLNDLHNSGNIDSIPFEDSSEIFGKNKRNSDIDKEEQLYKSIFNGDPIPRDYPRPDTEGFTTTGMTEAGMLAGILDFKYHTTGHLGTAGYTLWDMPRKYDEYKSAFDDIKYEIQLAKRKINNIKEIYPYSKEFANQKLINNGCLNCECCIIIKKAADAIVAFIKTWSLYPKGSHREIVGGNYVSAPYAYRNKYYSTSSSYKTISFEEIDNDIVTLQTLFNGLFNSHNDLHKLSTKIHYKNIDTGEIIYTNPCAFEGEYAPQDDRKKIISLMVSSGYKKDSIKFNNTNYFSTPIPQLTEEITFSEYGTPYSEVTPEYLETEVSGKKEVDSERHIFRDNVVNKKDSVQILTGGLKLEPFDDFSLDEDGCGITVQKEGYSKSYSSARFAVPFVDPHNSHPMQFDFEHEAEYKEKINIKIKIELYDITNEKISDETNEIKEEYISYTSKSERASEIKKIEDFYNDVAEKYIPTSSDDKKFTKMDNKSPVEIKTASDIIGSSTINITYRFKKREKVCTVSIYDNNELIQTSDIWFNDKLPIPNSYIVDNEHDGSIMAKYGTEFLIKKSLTHEWFFNPCKAKTPLEDIRLDVKYLGLLRMGANTVFYSWINGKTERERLHNSLVKWDIDSISPKTQKTYISELKAYMLKAVKQQVIDHVKSKFNEDITENQIKIDDFYTIDPLVEIASIKPNEIPETKIYYDFLVKDISNKNTITYASNIEGIYSNKVEVDDGDQITEFPYTEDYEDANGNIYLFDHTEPTLPITINNKDQTVTGHWVEPKYFYESPVYFGLNIKFWIDKSENRVYDYDGSIDGVKSFVEKVYKEYYIKNGQKVYTGRYKTEKGKIKKYDNGWHWSITLPPKGTTVSTGWFSSAEVNRWQITDLDSGSVAEYEGGRKINIAYNHWYKELPQIDTTTIQVEVEAIIGPEPPKYKVSYGSNISINPMPESFETKEVESGTIISEFPYTEDVTIDGKTYKFDHTEPTLPITITKDTTITGIWIEKENGENGEGHIPEILDWKPFGYYVGIAKFWYNYEDAVVFNPESIECSAEIGAFYYNDENGNEIITGYTDSSAEKLKQSPYIEGLGLNEITLPMIESGTVYNIEGIEITINNPRWRKVGSNETFAPGEKVKIDWSSEEPYPITNFVLECD